MQRCADTNDSCIYSGVVIVIIAGYYNSFVCSEFSVTVLLIHACFCKYYVTKKLHVAQAH